MADYATDLAESFVSIDPSNDLCSVLSMARFGLADNFFRHLGTEMEESMQLPRLSRTFTVPVIFGGLIQQDVTVSRRKRGMTSTPFDTITD